MRHAYIRREKRSALLRKKRLRNSETLEAVSGRPLS
jgi:hypothetical protein